MHRHFSVMPNGQKLVRHRIPLLQESCPQVARHARGCTRPASTALVHLVMCGRAPWRARALMMRLSCGRVPGARISGVFSITLPTNRCVTCSGATPGSSATYPGGQEGLIEELRI
eukprot:3060692-Prymnesium_polylepis.1